MSSKQQNVFLTGVTGFVGRYLLYQLCDAEWVDEVYVLIRPKKNLTPQERLVKLLEDKLFEKARELGTSFDKVKCIAGDVEKAKLGMSPEAIKTLSKKLTLVIHNAAALSFAQSLQEGFRANTTGSWELYNMCCDVFEQKPAFCLVSTIATNSHLECVPEKVSRFSTKAKHIYNYLNNIPREQCDEIGNIAREGRLDGYAFSKGILEAMIMEDIEEKGGRVPVAFVRPGGIISANKGPVPGWIHDTCFFAQLGYFVYKGKIPFFLADRRNDINMAPVDLVGNMIMASSMDILEKREKKDFTHQVVNGSKCCVTGMTFDVILNCTRDNYDSILTEVKKTNGHLDYITWEKTGPSDPWYIQTEWIFEVLFSIMVSFPLFLYTLYKGQEERSAKKYKKLSNFLYKYVKVLKPYLTRHIRIENGYCDELEKKYPEYPVDASGIDRNQFTTKFLVGIGKHIMPTMEIRTKKLTGKMTGGTKAAQKKLA